MKILSSWLKEFLPHELPTDALVDKLTATGLEVGSVEQTGVNLPNVVVAKIESFEQHPNADRLSVCRVDDGSGHPRQIVCGAKNFSAGDHVPLALPGAVLPGNVKIKVGKLRGEESEGMMCSGKELGLGQDGEGLLLLPKDTVPGTPLTSLFPADTVFDLEITPNRPDWLSHLGVARELSAFLKTGVHHTPPAPVPEETSSGIATISPDSGCGFYSLRKISGVKVAPSPSWLAERLHKMGLRPVNNVVDVTNYVLHELGQPLHAFDAEKVTTPVQILSSRGGEDFQGLDGASYSLPPGLPVICDSNREVLALGGVLGGSASGVTDTTTDILLESAWFEPGKIRVSSRSTGIQTDSSYRFERGTDPQGALTASARAVELILEIAGGTASQEVFVAGSPPPAAKPVLLAHDKCCRLLDVQLSDAQIIEALETLGLRCLSKTPNSSTWQPPTYRIDLHRDVDLIEEVARIIGIEAIPSRVAAIPSTRLAADHKAGHIDRLRATLVSLGFDESRLSTLVSSNDLFGKETSAIRLKNPLGADQSFLRPSLLPGLLHAAARNFRNGLPDLRIFECGPVFSNGEREQDLFLGLVACGTVVKPTWNNPSPPMLSFYDLTGLLNRLYHGKLAFRPSLHPQLVVCAEILHEEKPVGIAGVLHPGAAEELDASSEVLVAEIRLQPFLDAQISSAKTPWSPVARYPSVTRDLAVLLPIQLPFSEVSACILRAKTDLLKHFQPFDIFTDPTGEKLPTDRKSVAVSLTFQSSDRTLESSEIDAEVARLKETLKSELNAEFRE